MSVSDDALARLRRALDEQEFEPGGRLPPERELATHLGVGRSSLRTALDQLVREGRIWRHVGQGTFVTETTSSEALTRLRFDSSPSPADVLELRQMVEPSVAAVAALRATSNDIERLGELVDQGYRASSWQEWERVDGAFHSALASVSRNPLLVGVLETLHAVRGEKEGPVRRTYADNHRAVVESISARDPAAAAAAMRTHLWEVHKTLSGGHFDSARFVSASDGGASA